MTEAYATSIEGNRQLLDGGAMFGNAPRPIWEKWIAPDSVGRIPLACRCLLLEFNGVKVLCETGIGAFFDPKMSERFGVQTPDQHLLLENLRAMGHSPDSIDFVILSHLHFDHAGGLLPPYAEISGGNQDLVFPKAKFLVGKEAWERALHPHSRDKASFIPGLTDKLKDSGRLVIVSDDPLPKELRGYVEFIISGGHTPGQMHTLFTGPKHKIFFCADLIPGLPWVHLPITMGYDRFPEQLIDEKVSLYRRAVPEDWLLFFTHDPAAAAAQVRPNSSGRFEPVQVEKTLLRKPV